MLSPMTSHPRLHTRGCYQKPASKLCCSRNILWKSYHVGAEAVLLGLLLHRDESQCVASLHRVLWDWKDREECPGFGLGWTPLPWPLQPLQGGSVSQICHLLGSQMASPSGKISLRSTWESFHQNKNWTPALENLGKAALAWFDLKG